MTVILCHCEHRHLLPAERLAAFRAALRASGVEVIDIGDACHAAESPPPELLSALASDETVLAGCHGRALQALMAFATGDCGFANSTVDLRSGTLEEALSALGISAAPAARGTASTGGSGGSDAWYPTIDRERCTDCGRCHEFCLFGVYSRDADGHVVVSHPLNCKTNCPACARICPQNAIIFPKSEDEAINGATLSAEELASARIRLDPDDLASGDIYSKLRTRQKKSNSLPPLFRQGLFKEDTSHGAADSDEGRAPKR